jgi:hypothetical protein
MSDPAPPTSPAYLTAGDLPFPAIVHRPPAGVAATGVGVLFCSPFGWEDMSSYRPRRVWAQELAAAGAVVLRFDLPGTGDAAGGPRDAGRVPAWTDAVAAAAAHLRLAHGCRRVVAIGIGTGGLLALTAAQDGAAIDDFVLWGTAARGRAVLRQLGLFARMEAEARAAEGQPDEDDGTVEEGALEVGGYLLGAESAAALKALDLRAPQLPGGPGRRALLLEQDGISVDAALRDGLAAAGVAVTAAPGPGFGKMMLEPQFSRPPRQVIATVVRWLAETPAGDGPAPVPASAPAVADELVVEDAEGGAGGYREHFVTVAHPDGDLFGVACEPLGAALPLRALFLGGTGHRIGPNRMWVEAARRWAARGVPSVRLDFAGVGDAGGSPPDDVPALYRDLYVGQFRHVVDALDGAGEDRPTVSVALCAAAYWAVQGALETERRVVPFMVNPGALSWTPEGHQEHMRRHYRRLLLRRETWRRLARGEVSWTNAPKAFAAGLAQAPRRVLRRGGGAAAASRPAGTLGVLDGLRDRGVHAMILLAGRESVLEELHQLGAMDRVADWPNVAFEVVPGRADLHTLRPLWVQHRVHARLDAGLDAELARLGLGERARPAA